MTINGKTWSRGANSRLPFDVKGNLNLSIILCVWNSLFMTPFITLPSVWVLIQVCFVANREEKIIINFKNYTTPWNKIIVKKRLAKFRK